MTAGTEVQPTKKRRSKLEGREYKPGNPVRHVLGRDEEQPARIHAPLPPRKRHISDKTILADIKLRRQNLEPLVDEYKLLLGADEALKDI